MNELRTIEAQHRGDRPAACGRSVRPEEAVSTAKFWFELPGNLYSPVQCHTVTEIRINQTLIRDARFLCHTLEVPDNVFERMHSNRIFEACNCLGGVPHLLTCGVPDSVMIYGLTPTQTGRSAIPPSNWTQTVAPSIGRARDPGATHASAQVASSPSASGTTTCKRRLFCGSDLFTTVAR